MSKKLTVVISIILIVAGVLMRTLFKETLNQIDIEAFDFLSALILGIGVGMVIKFILPTKKKTDK